MANICVDCGLPQDDMCTCVEKQPVKFEDLTYTAADYKVPKALVSRFMKFSTNEQEKLQKFTKGLEGIEKTPRNVRLAYVWSVFSIQTDSEKLDKATKNILKMNDFGALKDYVMESRDHNEKWEKVHEFWTSNIPKKVANHLQNEEWVKAQAVLSGLSTRRGRTYHYMRPTKANMVTSLFGDPNALCLDSRRWDVLKPLLKRMMPNSVRGPDHDHPQDELGTYRHESLDGRAEYKMAWSQNFLQSGKGLARSPEELRLITTEILDTLEKNTVADRNQIGHILFCLGGKTTYHESLIEMFE